LFAKASADNDRQNVSVATQGRAKYVFLFIGYCMAMTHINTAEVFSTARSSAGTAITAGYKTLSGVINMDPGRTQKYKTLAE